MTIDQHRLESGYIDWQEATRDAAANIAIHMALHDELRDMRRYHTWVTHVMATWGAIPVPGPEWLELRREYRERARFAIRLLRLAHPKVLW